MFSPLNVDPTKIRVMSFESLDKKFSVEDVVGKRNYLTRDYALKVFSSEDTELSNELLVSGALNTLIPETSGFVFTHGYILSPDIPPDYKGKKDARHFVYLFSDKVEFDFDELPDEPKINENFYFEILIALYYARKRFNFVHWDIHSGQLMYNQLSEKTTRAYKIDDFFVNIADSDIEPKLVDYGKSMVASEYTDERWREPQFKKMWNKSDIYHLSLIFSHRNNLSSKFRDFLQGIVLPMYKSSMYATRLEKDSGANYKNIENLLRIYFVDTG